MAAGALRAPSNWRELPSAEVLLVCGDTDRPYVLQGRRYSPLVDSLGDALALVGCTTASIAARYSQFVGNAAHGAPASYSRDLCGIAALARAKSFTRGRVAAAKWQVDCETDLWTEILRRTDPVVVLAIQPDIALCRAGSSLGCKVYDVQHGAVSNTVDGSYYASTRLESLPLSDLPHGYLCWDDQSAAEIIAATSRVVPDVQVVGNPWLIRFAEPKPNDRLVQTELQRVAGVGSRAKPTVLVTLQYNQREYAPDYARNGVMAESLVDAIQFSGGRYDWHIRLHPSQLIGAEAHRVGSFLRECFGSSKNVEWEASSQVALPALLSRVDLHLTHYSAATTDAAAFGVRTGLLSPHFATGGKHANLFCQERKSGNAVPVGLSATAISAFIEQALRRGRGPCVAGQHAVRLGAFFEQTRSSRRRSPTSVTRPGE